MSLEELGVRPVINAYGTVTFLGGTVVRPEAVEAWKEGARVFVDMRELHEKAGNHIARMAGAEGAYIVSGATAGLVLSAAACITRGELARMAAIPRAGTRNRLVVQRAHRNSFVFNMEAAGAEILEIGGEVETRPEDLERALQEREKVAAVVYFAFDPQEGVLPLASVLKMAHAAGVPVIVDAAAELPPAENLRRFIAEGVDLVVFSGGKAIGAPNDTGIILGRSDLIRTCARLGPHNSELVGSEPRSFIGRTMKVGKEDILSLVAALSAYLREDHQEEMNRWERLSDSISAELVGAGMSGIVKMYPSFGYHVRPLVIPKVEVDFEGNTAISATEAAERLKTGDPPIYVYTLENKLYINPQCLTEEEASTVVSTLLTILKAGSRVEA